MLELRVWATVLPDRFFVISAPVPLEFSLSIVRFYPFLVFGKSRLAMLKPE